MIAHLKQLPEHTGHCAGHGSIRAGELIFVNILPRRTADGYWGDMRRTCLKGLAIHAKRCLVRVVREIRKMAIDMIKPGVTGGKVNDAVRTFFEKEGDETVRCGRNPQGFFHSLGHGVGLAAHEEPFMRSGAAWMFRKGMMVTVMPGFCHNVLGGCRIGDVVHVIPGACQLISRAPCKREIP